MQIFLIIRIWAIVSALSFNFYFVYLFRAALCRLLQELSIVWFTISLRLTPLGKDKRGPFLP
jgi:hypothetical protein